MKKKLKNQEIVTLLRDNFNYKCLFIFLLLSLALDLRLETAFFKKNPLRVCLYKRERW